MFERLLGSWKWLIKPSTLILLLAIIITLLLVGSIEQKTLTPALRFVGVLGLGSVFAIAHTIAYSSKQENFSLLEHFGLIQRFSFKDRPENSQKSSPQTKNFFSKLFLRGMLFLLSFGTILALLLWITLGLENLGTLALLPHSPTESYLEETATSSLRVNLGGQIELQQVNLTETGWQAHLSFAEYSASSQTNQENFILRQNQTQIIHDRTYRLQEIHPNPEIAAVLVRATNRETQEEQEILLQKDVPINIGDHYSFLLQNSDIGDARFGVSAQIAEFLDETLLREEWIFMNSASFDATHGSGNWSLEILDITLENSVILAVIPSSISALSWLFWPWIVLNFLFVITLWREKWTIIEQSENYALIYMPGISPRFTFAEITTRFLSGELNKK